MVLHRRKAHPRLEDRPVHITGGVLKEVKDIVGLVRRGAEKIVVPGERGVKGKGRGKEEKEERKKKERRGGRKKRERKRKEERKKKKREEKGKERKDPLGVCVLEHLHKRKLTHNKNNYYEGSFY
ncbi:MAG: hypothetical protein L3K26_19415 [Candidatus Hydrogenedentes bacterium]|nr:hypothetical protein [Candidatus Hydrogenedentota bacterium]